MQVKRSAMIVGVLAFGLVPEHTTTAATASTVETEVVTLRVGGFSPPKIQRPPGPFTLIVQNRTQGDKFSVQVTSVSLLQAIAPKEFATVTDNLSLDLPLGTYTVADLTHPTWRPLQITIK